MKTKFSKVIAALLVVMLIASSLPVLAVSASSTTSFTNSQLSIITDKASTLAPGVTQDAYTVYNNNGEQVKMFVTKADMSTDTVKLFASYKDMDSTNYGMSKLTEQVAAFNEKAAAGDEYYQGTVVAGINASYYNMISGKPTGTFVMNGIDVTTESEGNAYGYFAVMKDGSVKIGTKNEYSSDKGNIQEAIGIYTMLIVDGEICSGLDTTKYYPRQTIGITADGDVILMTADGNQAPKSIGLTVQEQAQVMLDLGCVWAGHLDGGGSCTYAAKAEGSNDFAIVNSPSDGSERSVSNGFLIVSTAVSDGSFDSAVLTAESEYVTPNSTVSISATGVDSVGGPAELPENVTWQMADDSYGTVADGVFTSTGKTGAAVVQMLVDGKVVGETTINVVIPDAVSLVSSELTVPYSKSVDIGITATYGVKDVAVKPSDFNITLTNTSVGVIDGFTFTACDEDLSITTSDIVISCVYDESVSVTAKINLGKGSEVVFDFEDGTNQNVVFNETPGTKYNYVWPESTNFIADADIGEVHSGNYALGAHINYGNSMESGYMKTSVYSTETKVFENAVRVGTWVYIPDECVGLWARWTLLSVTGYNSDGTPIWGSSVNGNTMDTTAGGTGVVYTFDEPGWHYLSVDTSAYSAVGWKANGAMMQFYISDRDGSAYNYVAAENSNIPGKFTFYIDDITVDYSTAVDDREAPVFSDITYAVSGMPDAAVLNNQTVDNNTVTFGATVADYAKSNSTGINVSTVKAYIDGVEVNTEYANGIVSVTDVILTNGKHVVKFAAEDNMGNYGYKYGYITVNAAESTSTVKLVAADPDADRILLGSIYNMNLVASAIEEVDTVVVDIDLDNNSVWQLDYMTPAEGFDVSYSLETTDNIATITVTRTGENTQTGEATLVTIPVRTWELKTGYTYPNGTKAGQEAYTYANFKSLGEFWRMSVIANVDMGVLTRVDGSVDTFTGERVFCDTEMWANKANMIATTEGLAYFNAWNGGHIHTAEAIDDADATCTVSGYTDRTFCSVCNSVVDWGTTVSATGHTYAFVDGILMCADDNTLYNGVYTDGKTYVDGVALEGWNNDSYFVDGVALTGVQLVDGYYYDFAENGVCVGQVKFTGLFYDESVEAYRYSKLGELAGGWHQIDDNWHYFKSYTKVAATGEYTQNGVTYQFDETGMTKGAWHTTDVGTRYYYGPDFYIAREPGYMTLIEIDGKTYNFDNDGYLTYGIQVLRDSTSFKKYAFEFGEDGAMIREIKDYGMLLASDGGIYYINEEGYVPMDAGVIEYDGYYYYVVHSGKIKINNVQTVTEAKANGLVEAGTYYFNTDGKMEVLEEVKNGVVNDNGLYYYYIDGVMQKDLGIIEVDGNYYYVCYSGKLKAGNVQTVTEAKANGLVEAGTYYFGTDGKMEVLEEVKNGVVNDNGLYYYYIDGVMQKDLGIIEVDGNYYYVCYSGKLKAGNVQTVTEAKANGLVEAGTYYFGTDGKMTLS